jgi:hypothetical protein
VTLGLVFAFWLGGLVGLFGTIVGTWNRPASTEAEKDAFAAFARERPALVFGLVVVLVVLWPGLVLYLLAEKADEKPGPPAPQG